MGKLTNEELCNQIKVHDCLETYTNNTYLDGESTDIMERYKKLKNSTLIDPCTGNDIDLDQTLLDACVRGDNPENALDGMDKIIEDASLSNDCPILSCIFNKMVNGELGTDFVCNLLSAFEGDNSNTNLTISSASGSTLNGNAGSTQTSLDGNQLIRINKDLCEKGINANPIAIFELLQHELIHASIQSYLADEFGWQGDAGTYLEHFNKLLHNTYGPYPTEQQHNLMLDRFLIPMVSSLQQMNGGGSYSDYVGLILKGFPDDVLVAAGYDLSEVQSLYEHSIGIIKIPDNLLNKGLSKCL